MSFISALSVYNVNSPKCRIGNERDGGYILNDIIINNAQRLISIGIGGEDSFELQWAEKFPNCVMEAYDGTYPCNNLCHKFPDRINKNIFYVHHNVGFGEKEIPINTIVDTKTNVLLKVDIEGGEYSVFDNFNDSNIVGLTLEIHDLHVEHHRQKIAELINNQFKNLILFHIHGNSWGGTFDLNLTPDMQPGLIIHKFPHVMELSFVSKKLVNSYTIDTQKFPVPNLDTSNRHDFEDIDLYWVNKI